MKIALLFSLCAISFAQQPRLAFEVVSIKPAPKGNNIGLMRDGKMHYNVDDARVDFGAIELMNILVAAFELPYDQVKAPDWTTDARYDVLGKIPAGATKKQVPQMLLAMLEDRFKLQYHREQKILPVYDLKLGDGKPKMKESVAGENEQGAHACNGGGDHRICHHVTMDDLAQSLTSMVRMMRNVGSNAEWVLDRPVIDATGLKGEFDFEIGFGPIRGNPSDQMVKTMMQGVKDLGLKLESGKQAFDFVIVDHLERVPTEN